MESTGSSEYSSEYLEDSSSLDIYNFVHCMNSIGWPRDGEFVKLLSTLDYRFYNLGGGRLVITRRYDVQAVFALSLLIFEL